VDELKKIDILLTKIDEEIKTLEETIYEINKLLNNHEVQNEESKSITS